MTCTLSHRASSLASNQGSYLPSFITYPTSNTRDETQCLRWGPYYSDTFPALKKERQKTKTRTIYFYYFYACVFVCVRVCHWCAVPVKAGRWCGVVGRNLLDVLRIELKLSGAARSILTAKPSLRFPVPALYENFILRQNLAAFFRLP